MTKVEKALLVAGVIVLFSGSSMFYMSFSDGRSFSEEASIGPKTTAVFGDDPGYGGMGFYKIEVLDYNRTTFAVKVTDKTGNFVSGTLETTKALVGYFNLPDGGYNIEVRSMADRQNKISFVHGSSRNPEWATKNAMIVAGSLLVTIWFYIRMRRYITEHVKP